MKFIPRPDLPLPLIEALTDAHVQYQVEKMEHMKDAPEHDFELSVTTLTRAPREYQLFLRHHDEVTVDPLAECWFSLQGNIIHYILDKYAKKNDRFIAETRIGKVIEVRGVRVYIHGQLDLYDKQNKELTDWKYQSATAAMYEKPEYHAQLNILRWLAYNNPEFPHHIETLQNVKLFRQLDVTKMSMEGYPKENAQFDPIEKWSKKKVEKYITTRATMHLMARDALDDNLPECSDAERWIRDSYYKVYTLLKSSKEKRFRKTASFSGSYEECKEYIEQLGVVAPEPISDEDQKRGIKEVVSDGVKLVCVKGKATRCISWCSISGFCNQFRKEVQESLPEFS